MLLIVLFFIIFAYLLGSINCAILVAKLFHLQDPRQQGSKNPGTTNVMRIGGKKAAAIVLIGDVLKGVIPVLAANALSIHGFWLGMIGLAAIAGHMYPIFFHFKGGKGVATTLGVIFCLSLWLGIIMLLVFLGILFIFRYVSLASIIAIAITPIVVLFLNQASYFVPLMLIAILVTLRHHENIDRLRVGIESKFQWRR